MNTGNILWALFVPGPDDLWPMSSREAADEAVAQHNAIVDADDWPYPDIRDSCRARVVEWPYGAESHAELLESGESETLSSNDLRIPDGVASAMVSESSNPATANWPYGSMGEYVEEA